MQIVMVLMMRWKPVTHSIPMVMESRMLEILIPIMTELQMQ